MQQQVKLTSRSKKKILRWLSWDGSTVNNKDFLSERSSSSNSNSNDKYKCRERESLYSQRKLSDGSRRKSKECVPRGSLAVYVGSEQRRYVIPTSYLSIPEIRVLMDDVGEENGFKHDGAIQIPCDEDAFEDILSKMPNPKKK